MLPPIPQYPITLIREVDMRARGGYKSYYEKEQEKQKANDNLSVRLVEAKKVKGSGEKAKQYDAVSVGIGI